MPYTAFHEKFPEIAEKENKMQFGEANSAWFKKGATLSDKSARKKKNQDRAGTDKQRAEEVENPGSIARTKKSRAAG